MSDVGYTDQEDENFKLEIWLVVHFVEENSVEVVPKKWFIGKSSECYWPAGDMKRALALIKQCVSPNTKWTRHKVIVLGEYSNFNTASKKLIKAKSSDILSSDNDSLKRRKFFKRKIVYSSDEDPYCDESDSSYPAPPNFLKKSKENKIAKQFAKKNNENDNILMNKQQTVKEAIPLRENYLESPICTVINDERDTTEDSRKELANSATSTGETGFQKQVFRLLHTINYRLNNIQEDLNILINRKGNAVIQKDSENDNKISDIIKSMPFDSKEAVDNLENLNDEEVKLLSQELSLIGGNSVLEATKTLMYRVMTNRLGSTYTWEGLKAKNQLKSLKITQAIIRAIRLNPKITNAQELDVIKVIKAWLLRAKERHANYQKKNEALHN